MQASGAAHHTCRRHTGCTHSSVVTLFPVTPQSGHTGKRQPASSAASHATPQRVESRDCACWLWREHGLATTPLARLALAVASVDGRRRVGAVREARAKEHIHGLRALVGTMHGACKLASRWPGARKDLGMRRRDESVQADERLRTGVEPEDLAFLLTAAGPCDAADMRHVNPAGWMCELPVPN